MLRQSLLIAALAHLLPALVVALEEPVHVGNESARKSFPESAVAINLYDILGPDSYLRGVGWQPLRCFGPVRQSMERHSTVNATVGRLAALHRMMMQDLVAALAESLNVSTAVVSHNSSFLELFGVPNFSYERCRVDERYRRRVMRRASVDPRFYAWLRRLSLVAFKYTVADYDQGKRLNLMTCINETIAGLIGSVAQLPRVDCSNITSIFATVGLFPDGLLRLSVVAERVLINPGWCSLHATYAPYGQWLKREQLLRRDPQAAADFPAGAQSQTQRFRDIPHKDRLLLLFDILYEVEQAFKKQHWLGSVAQQNPFDGYAIMDIIHSLSPGLVVETGTANGGSALMWANMLEMASPGRGRVVTMDVNEPTSRQAMWAGTAKRNATDHALWHKYVTFIKGSSVDPVIVRTVRQLVDNTTGAVIVLLDSDHTEMHVLKEARTYCPLVTKGSYCIVQDTKLSRFSAAGGPTAAVRAFLAENTDFIQDRAREPFYTHHVGGYLLRVKAPAPAVRGGPLVLAGVGHGTRRLRGTR